MDEELWRSLDGVAGISPQTALLSSWKPPTITDVLLVVYLRVLYHSMKWWPQGCSQSKALLLTLNSILNRSHIRVNIWAYGWPYGFIWTEIQVTVGGNPYTQLYEHMLACMKLWKNPYAYMIARMVTHMPMKMPLLDSFEQGKYTNNAYGHMVAHMGLL